MIAHVSPSVQAYNETLQVIQLASRIHRMKRRKASKVSSLSLVQDDVMKYWLPELLQLQTAKRFYIKHENRMTQLYRITNMTFEIS